MKAPPLISEPALRTVAVALALAGATVAIGGVSLRTSRMGTLPPPAPPPEGSLRPKMVVIPSGTYTVLRQDGDGAERRYSVKLPYRYAISETEVTQGQLRALTGFNPSLNTDCGESCPVERTLWLTSIAWLNMLSTWEGLTPCYRSGSEKMVWERPATCDGYRFPTEAEWEIAAFADGAGRWAGTDDEKDLCSFANVAGCGAAATEPVKKRKPNAWFLYGMTGNVWEWTWDCWEPGAAPRLTPRPEECEGDHVVRGGAFDGAPRDSVLARRRSSDGVARHTLGLRIARTIPPSALPSDSAPTPTASPPDASPTAGPSLPGSSRQ